MYTALDMTIIGCMLLLSMLSGPSGHSPSDADRFIAELVQDGETVLISLQPMMGCSLSAPCQSTVNVVFIHADGREHPDPVVRHEFDAESFAVNEIPAPFNGTVIVLSEFPVLVRVVPARVRPALRP